MVMSVPVHSPSSTDAPLRYLESATPILFPESEKVSESQLHLELRTLLYQLLQDAFEQEATVGSDQFVYFDASDPKRSLAPDVYVRRGRSSERIRSWKVWERGAPEVAIEIISDNDAPELPWNDKFQRYRSLGILELVRFDPAADTQPLRIWDRVDEVLTERQIEGSTAPSLVLDLEWVLAPAEGMARVLRIAQHGVLVPTRKEAREAAEARVRELEAQLEAQLKARR